MSIARGTTQLSNTEFTRSRLHAPFLIAMGEIDWRRELDLIREVSVRDDWVRSSESGRLAILIV